MIINYCSDIHTEFWIDEKDYFHPGEGDVLVLAGDIGLAADLHNPASMFHKFLRDCVRGYNKVFMTLGNHSHYDYDFQETLNTHRHLIPKEISLLENQSECYEGVHFVGATLWADFMNGNAQEMQYAGSVMNDYHIIMNGKNQLQPSDTLMEHDNTIKWFNQVLPTLNGKIVMITHHCPSHQSIHSEYANRVHGAYATNLSHMIHHYAPVAWIHGHVHVQNDYMIGETRVLSAPRGYAPNQIDIHYEVGSIEV